jgi:hypothetical protein
LWVWGPSLAQGPVQPEHLDLGEIWVSSPGNIIATLPSLSGNVAIDLVCLIVALCAAIPFLRGTTHHLYDAQKKRTTLITLRKTLELKSVEMAALRAAMMHMREDLSQQRQERLDEEAERARLSHLAAQREFDPQYSELEQRLHAAVSKPPRRFDA